MKKVELLSLILDSWNSPVVFADVEHIIRYMNAPARKAYEKWGDVIGKSVFSCHNENSCRIIQDIFLKLQNGAEEVLYSDNKKHRVYMRGMRDREGHLLGYYERYEAPRSE